MAGNHDARHVVPRPIEHRAVADALYQCAAGSFGQAGEQRVACLGIGRGGLDLDQLMVSQGALGLPHDGVGQTGRSEANHRLERMGQRAEMAALAFGECLGSGHWGILQTDMAKRSQSSGRWLNEHFSDPFVKRAQAEGWRSRAAFKLEEIDLREKMFRSGVICLDLGAAPGAWSQYARRRLGRSGQVLATDILPMAALAGVEFVQGDFRDPAVFDGLLERLPGRQVDWVLSDMAPALSGIDAVDQPRAMDLAELALDMAGRVLKPGGGALIKLFQGAGFEALVRTTRRQFGKVKLIKPTASRARSAEMYMLAKDYRLV